MAPGSGPLAAYRVLDLTGARGILCGKILADLGADDRLIAEGVLR